MKKKVKRQIIKWFYPAFQDSGEKVLGEEDHEGVLPIAQPIEVAFPSAVNLSQAKCAFYDLQRLKWSPKGCQLNEAETGGNIFQSCVISKEEMEGFCWALVLDAYLFHM